MTFHLGLIGYPLGHSISPKIHAAALQACGLQGNYSLFPIHADDQQGLKDLLARVRSGELHGLNVTIPHKQKVIEFMDDLTPTTQSIGAVNTIYLRDNKLVGDNTDAAGFLADLKKGIGNRESEKSAVILGAGGSARAVVYALLNDGWNVTLAARRLEQAEQLANEVTSDKLQVASYSELQSSIFDLLVNATPVGMFPNMDASPLPNELSLHPNTFVYDLVYNPRETKLIRNARSQGLRATTGLGMLIEQAALSFEIWTGCTPPRDVLYTSVVE
ncbi:MAG TPA: shikimate dehydrogenase [Anaerolineales bacterium]|nr:shikimate dehydrogenase [Anaerolineales bacterium]